MELIRDSSQLTVDEKKKFFKSANTNFGQILTMIDSCGSLNEFNRYLCALFVRRCFIWILSVCYSL